MVKVMLVTKMRYDHYSTSSFVQYLKISDAERSLLVYHQICPSPSSNLQERR
jgi:hypothetical protein